MKLQDMINNSCGGVPSTDALAMRFLRERLRSLRTGSAHTYTYIYTCVHIDGCLGHGSRNRSSTLLQLLFELGKAPQNVYIPRGLTKSAGWERPALGDGCTKNIFTACLGQISHCSAWPYGGSSSRPRDQSQALTKLQPDILHPRLSSPPPPPPLPPTYHTFPSSFLPPSLISPTAPFPPHSCQSCCTTARPNTTPDLLAWAEPAALTCRCSRCVSSAPYLGLAEPKKRTGLDASSTSFTGATKTFATEWN